MHCRIKIPIHVESMRHARTEQSTFWCARRSTAKKEQTPRCNEFSWNWDHAIRHALHVHCRRRLRGGRVAIVRSRRFRILGVRLLCCSVSCAVLERTAAEPCARWLSSSGARLSSLGIASVCVSMGQVCVLYLGSALLVTRPTSTDFRSCWSGRRECCEPCSGKRF